MLKNSNIRVGNLIASGKEFNSTSIIGQIRSIDNDDAEFEQIETMTKDSFEWLFKDNYCGIPVTEDMLIESGFKKHETIIIDSYSISISNFAGSYKVLSMTIENGNQYIYVREGDSDNRNEDDVVNIFNGDINGPIYFHHVQNLYSLLSGKELVFDLEKIINNEEV